MAGFFYGLPSVAATLRVVAGAIGCRPLAAPIPSAIRRGRASPTPPPQLPRYAEMAKDKEKVIDEVWTEARIAEFLDARPAQGIDADFHVLLKAYQAMRAEDFDIFIGLFTAQKRNINALDPGGRTLLSYVREHRNSDEFARILEQNGAQ
jgi:hypothetical protein